MADFTALATEFVLSETAEQERDIITRAANAIQSAAGKAAAVSSWAQSIAQWMPRAADVDDMDDGEDGDGDDVVARAKALGFLAGTLGALDRDFLRDNQVDQLATFFGRMFSLDHKAGVMPAALALRHLAGMKHFKPDNSTGILGDICELGDDFHRQVPATRWEIYGLLEFLLCDDAVRLHLRAREGQLGTLMARFLQLCRHERDPRNLMTWFKLLRLFLHEYPNTASTVDDVFKAYSAYFPVSMRSSTAPSGVTVDDLKLALRGCFSASHLAAAGVFSFLVEKLDQGDAVSLSVKLDILRTLQSCVEAFPADAVAPHASQIWNSLKYEVRNGEVEETVSCTLDVIRATSKRLSPSPAGFVGDGLLADFITMSLGDCLADLSDPMYAKNSGSLLTYIAAGSIEAFGLTAPRLTATLKSDLGRATLPAHTRDLIAVLNDVLEVRRELVSGTAALPGTRELEQTSVNDSIIHGLLDDVYMRQWNGSASAVMGPSQVTTLREIMKGLTELIRQPAQARGTGFPVLCSDEDIISVVRLLIPCVVWPFHSAAPFPPPIFHELAAGAMFALQQVISVYPPAFNLVVSEISPSILGQRLPEPSGTTREPPPPRRPGIAVWTDPRPQDLIMLKEMLSRLANIGLSSVERRRDAAERLNNLTSALLRVMDVLLAGAASFQASAVLLSGIHSAMLNFRDACQGVGIVPGNRAREPATGLGTNHLAMAVAPTGEEQETDVHRPSYSDTRGTRDEDLKDEQLLGEYLKTCVGLIVHIHRQAIVDTSATSEPAGAAGKPSRFYSSPDDPFPDMNTEAAAELLHRDLYLHQVARMAAFVLRDLSEAEQRNLELHKEAFRLFEEAPLRRRLFDTRDHGRLDVLTMGIFRGLRPALLNDMRDLDFVPVDVFGDFGQTSLLPERTLLARNGIASLVANKYGPDQPGTPVRKAWDDAVAFIKVRLSDESATSMEPSQFLRMVAFIAGGLARLDPGAKDLASLLIATPPRFAEAGETMARAMGQLLLANDNLNPESLAAIKPLYKQWVYAHLARPLITMAQPGGKDDSKAKICAIALVALLQHTPFAMYDDDADGITRVLVAALTRTQDWLDRAAVFDLLACLVENGANAPRDHMTTIVDGAAKAFSDATAAARRPRRTGAAAAGNRHDAAACRRQIVRLLSRLPTSYDHRYLLPLSSSATRLLSSACGDSVRQVREAAQIAREGWAGVH